MHASLAAIKITPNNTFIQLCWWLSAVGTAAKHRKDTVHPVTFIIVYILTALTPAERGTAKNESIFVCVFKFLNVCVYFLGA